MSSSNGMMSQAEIEALMASMNGAADNKIKPEEAPAEALSVPSAAVAETNKDIAADDTAGGPMSQAEIAEFLAMIQSGQNDANEDKKTDKAAPAADFLAMIQGEQNKSVAVTAEPEPITTAPASDPGGMMSQDEIAAMLAAMNNDPEPVAEKAPEPATPAPASDPGGMMSQDEIAAMLAAMNNEPDKAEEQPAVVEEPTAVVEPEPITPNPAPASASDPGGMMSQDEIAAMLAAMNNEPEPVAEKAPEPATPASASDPGGMMSQDEIAAMLAAMNTEQEPVAEKTPEPATPAPAIDPGGMMSQDEIAAMLASMNNDPEPVAEKTPEPITPAPASDPGGMMSQDEIAAMLAAMNNEQEPEKVEEKAPEPATSAPASDPGGMMSQDEIAAMLAAMNNEPDKAEEQPVVVEKPTAVVETAPITPSPAPASDSGGILSQDEIAALMSNLDKEVPAKEESAPLAATEQKIAATAPASTASPANTQPDNVMMSQDEIAALMAEMNEAADTPQPLAANAEESVDAVPAAKADDSAIAAATVPGEAVQPQPAKKNLLAALMLTIKGVFAKLPFMKKKAAQAAVVEAVTEPVTEVAAEGAVDPAAEGEAPAETKPAKSKLAALMPGSFSPKHAAFVGGGMLLVFLLGVGTYFGIALYKKSAQGALPAEAKLAAKGVAFTGDEFVKYAGRGNKEVITLFLDSGMDVNVRRASDGFTPLMAAASFNRMDVLDLLLNDGADLNVLNSDEATALMQAIKYNRIEAALALIQAGAKISQKDLYGNTAASLALIQKNPQIIEALIKHGATDLKDALEKMRQTAVKTPEGEKKGEQDKAADAAKTPAVSPDFLLGAGRAGHVQIGKSVEALYLFYDRNNIVFEAENKNGIPHPIVKIFLDGRSKPSIVASISINKQGQQQIVDGIQVYDERFKTADGIGINSTVGDMRKVQGFTGIKEQNESLYAVAKEPRLLFELELTVANMPSEWLESGNVSSIPDGMKVHGIVLQ